MTAQYQDDDLVYVDPAQRTVIGPVEFDANDMPVAKKYEGEGRRTHYPWGTYRSMKKAFRLEGKNRDDSEPAAFDEHLSAVLNDAY